MVDTDGTNNPGADEGNNLDIQDLETNQNLNPNGSNDSEGEGSDWADTNQGNDWDWEVNKKDVSEYTSFLNEVGQDHINKMVDDYEKLTEMLDDEAAISKMSKDDVIRMYKTEASLKQELDKILPMIEWQRDTAVNSYVDGIENEWLKWYLSELLDEMESPEEMEAFMEVFDKIIEFSWSKPSDNQTQTASLKKNLGWTANQNDSANTDPVQGMFSLDPKVRKSAAESMDKLLEDMLTAQYGKH